MQGAAHMQNPQLTRELLVEIKQRASALNASDPSQLDRYALIDHVELTKMLTRSELDAIRDRAEQLADRQDRFDVFILIAHVERSV